MEGASPLPRMAASGREGRGLRRRPRPLEARAARERLAAESKKTQDTTAKAVRTLVKGMHLSVRDAGELIGISPQRVHQLAHENG